jgi:outer membrane protein assembly factor BamB
MLAFSTAGVQCIVERAGASGWFAAARRGEDGIVEVLDDATLSIGRKGTFGSGSLRAAALDAQTGRLLLLLKPNHMEWFDTQEMRTISRVDLPCESVGFSVAVADGLAFVPTEQGTVLVVDANDGRLLRTVETGGRKVKLSMSRSGGTLAVSTREVQSDKTTRVGLRVFARQGAELTQIAETERKLRQPPNDIAVIDGSRLVILTGDETLTWHY